jgi:hypothetical protein
MNDDDMTCSPAMVTCAAWTSAKPVTLTEAIKAYGRECFDAGFRHAGMGLPHPDHKTHGPDDREERND